MSTVANKLGVTLNDHDIVFAERVGRHSSNLLREVQTGNQNRIEARPLVVHLARRITRDILLKNARVRRTITTVDLGLPYKETTKFYVNERLTKPNRVLFAKARETAQKLKWKFVWTKDGRVYVKRGDSFNAPVRVIYSEDDFTRIFGEPYSKSVK
ncbi:unnamed protein product [Parnassius apollo]|uniref:(apollo) hypothetical protein n=1 Tax=Parnassius apollo TaxID=110799 RepID=A0A8S3WS83_PARAO|nr:unnamed protein product [Parnassius apollo]